MKNLPANAGDVGSIPELGRSPGEGNGNSLLYSCLGNRMDRGARWATVQRFTMNWTRLSRHTHKGTLLSAEPLQGSSHWGLWDSSFPIFLLFSKLSVLWWEKTQFCPRDQWLDSKVPVLINYSPLLGLSFPLYSPLSQRIKIGSTEWQTPL